VNSVQMTQHVKDKIEVWEKERIEMPWMLNWFKFWKSSTKCQ